MTDSNIAVLDREMFTEAAAARFLQMSQSTLHWWLEGGTRRGKLYRPVVRLEASGNRNVTWAEFVELGLIRQYRSTHNVPLPELRATIDVLRDELQVPCPLAHARPFIGEGRKLLMRAQEEAALPADFCLVAVASGQLVLTSPSTAFFDRVEWSDDYAIAWKPHNDLASPVRMDPRHRFGLPAVGGIKTSTVWEHVQAGESDGEVAEAFGLTENDVLWAVAYETSSRSA
jgi:uncharacterized protein (DUF433 family)